MKIKETIRRIVFDTKYIFLNQFVCYIPSWTLRKMIYTLYGMRLDKSARIGIGTKVVSPKNITVGCNTVINEMCYLDGRGKLTIGSNTSISFGTTIVTGSHQSSNDFAYYTSPVVIEDHVWIGAKAIVLDGSTIRSGAIIGAGSVFKGQAEDKGIYVGNPSKLIKYRNSDLKYDINYCAFFR